MMSSGSKDRIVRSFKERVFQPGSRLIKEGDVPNLCSAYVIKEGHVNLLSRLNPYDVKFDEQGTLVGTKTRPEDSSLQSLGLQDRKRTGYMSHTTNHFYLTTKGRCTWVGEDILYLLPQEPFYFSVVAVGRVVALEISRADMVSKLPSQVVEWLRRGAQRRREWFY